MHFDWPRFFGHPFILFTISPKAASVSCGRCAMLMFRPLLVGRRARWRGWGELGFLVSFPLPSLSLLSCRVRF
uniref:Secreted protein n=1 Tax=Echinococcus granulosus TaxID=6210 RepID=A0A068WGS1_ECHGR|nr:hypothetical protein EgrG_000949400 [Echinococcus granulosus]